MKIYIAGPMTGLPNDNKEAFFEAENFLKDIGFSVFNPAWMNFDNTWDNSTIMLIDLCALAQCDGIYLLKGSSESKGAQMEYEYALHNKKILFFEETKQDVIDTAKMIKRKIKEIES